MKARKILPLLAMSVVTLLNCRDNLPTDPLGPTLKGETRADAGAGNTPDRRIVVSTGGGISVMNADGTNPVQILTSSTLIRDPSWSPNGQKIAFSGANGIYVVNQDGTGLDQMTSTDTTTANCHRRPRWSPDGTRIVFYRNTNCTSRPRSIMIVNVTTKQVTTVVPSGGESHAFPDWSHDGTRIVFSKPNPSGIFVVNVDGSNLTQISDANGFSRASWSPNDSLIAYSSPVGTTGTEAYLFLMNPDGSNVSQLPTVSQSGPFASWSPDGTRILYQAQSSVNVGPLRIIHADGSGDAAITGSMTLFGYDWGAATPPPPPSNTPPTPPTIDCIPTSTPTAQAITCSASGSTDADGDAITYVWSVTDRTGASQGTSTTYSRGTPGTTAVTAQATDGTDNSSNSNTVSLTFTNRSPSVPTVSCDTLAANIGETITCSASGSTDPDGGTITYNWSSTDRTGSATGSSTTYSRSTAGGTSVLAYATDAQGGQSNNSATVSLTFNNPPPPPNSAPTAPTVDCTPASTPTSQSITCTASGSTDVDGDAITYVWSASDRTGAAQGTSTTYSRALPGTTDVTAYATDGTDNSNSSNQVTLTFTNRSPSAPSVSCDTLTATTGQTITCSASGSTDPDGGTITYNWSSTDRTGSATGNSTSYSRATAGQTSVIAYATDNQGSQSGNSTTVTLTFNNPPPPPNSAPTAPTVDCIPTSTPTGQSITCTASGSTDVDGDAITYVWSANDRIGGAQGTSTTYSRATPGTTAVTAYATDGNDNSNNSNEVTLTFNNRSPNAPTVSCVPLTSTVGTAITCSASGSTDPDGGTIAYNWSATDRTGSATGNSTSYSRSTSGTTSVTAYASDGQSGQSGNSAAVTLTFNNPSPPPSIATTTVVSADPASPSNAVANVTFTAHVTRTSNGADVTTGNVEFRNGGTDCSSGTVLQSAAAVDGTGRKTFTTRVLQSRYAVRACYVGAAPYVASNGVLVWPPDTDGDGIVDASDTQPLVPSTRFNRNNVTVGAIVSVPSGINYYVYPGGWTNGVSMEFSIAPGATGTYADAIVIQLDGKATRYELHPWVNQIGDLNGCFAGKPCAIQISDPPASVALEVLDGQGTMVVVVNGETVVITVANGATGTVTEYKNVSGAVTEIGVQATGSAGGVTVNGYQIPAGTTTAFGRLQATNKISSGKAASLNLSGSFTPASSSDGMNPLTEQVVVRAGPYTWTIPAGAFRLNSDGAYVYSGILNGVTVSMQIKKPAAKKGGAWTFQVTAGPIITFALPAPIFFRIGNDAGSTSG